MEKKKYIVTYKHSSIYTKDVEAYNEKDAEDIAYNIYDETYDWEWKDGVPGIGLLSLDLTDIKIKEKTKWLHKK